MDAVEFLKYYQKMCKQYIDIDSMGEYCSRDCPFYGEPCDLSSDDLSPEYAINKIREWSSKTMMEDFFEKFPNASKKIDGSPTVCPFHMGYVKKQDDCEFFDGNCLKCWSRQYNKL